MNTPQLHPAGRARRHLVALLTATLAVSVVSAQTSDPGAVRRLQEENAALRKRLAELEGKAAPAQPAAAQPAPVVTRPAAAPAGALTASVTTDDDTVRLSPFEVQTDKDYGYLKTNSMTATRIGMEIQKVPLNISVISEEFLKDTNARNLTDLFRYSAASSGDTRFAMRIPANEATPQGAFTMRGFQVNNLMRNGVFRYISHNFDNVERIEVVKGPASVFFGQGYPGGVINFVTKRPSFSKLPTDFTYTMNNDSGERLTLDHNAIFSKKAAFRVVGAWEDSQGERRFEYRKSMSVSPSVTFIPLDNNMLKITAEMEFSRKQYNINDYDWIWSDFAGWQDAATKGTYGSSTATLSHTIAANAGNGLTAAVVQATTTPTLAYATYFVNKRNATNNLFLPAYTSVKRGAYYMNAAGQRVHDEAFNYTSRGAQSDELDEFFTVTADLAPAKWVDVRYVFSQEHAVHNSVGQGGAIMTPYANGIHWNVGLGNRSGYWRRTLTHNLDTVFKFDYAGTKNKLLAGFQRSTWTQQYLGGAATSDVNYAFLPGARNTTSNPDYAGTNVAKYDFGGVPVNQVIRQRDGTIKPVRQIYTNFDPGFEVYPDINQWFQDDRNALDGYKPTIIGTYLNYQGTFLKDRLNVLAGYREEKRWERGQWQVNNFPWYVWPAGVGLDTAKYPPTQWGYDPNYYLTNFVDIKGSSWMAGASYAITRNLAVYASSSKVFKFNTGNIGGYYPGDDLKYAQGIIDQFRSVGRTWTYRGQTITNVNQFLDAIKALKYPDLIPNEQGMNYEIGVKYATDDNKIVGTLSVFTANRKNRKLDDGVAQANTAEPLNYSADLDIIAGVQRGIAAGATPVSGIGAASSGRVFRVRAYGNDDRITGTEAEVIWTPKRNFQLVGNVSWLPQAETVGDDRPVYAEPGSAGYAKLTALQQRDAWILWKARLENVPEYRLNLFGKYTFTDNFLGDYGRGLTTGLGLRYSSKTVVSRSVDWNPLGGGYQAGNYLVWDLTLGYPFQVMGYKLRANLGIYNVTDEKYSEGSFAMSPARNWVFSTGMSF